MPLLPSLSPTPLISLFWITVPVTPALMFTTTKPPDVMWQFSNVTLFAVMFTVPLMSRPLITVPGLLIVMPPDCLRVMPTGTPVLEALGKPGRREKLATAYSDRAKGGRNFLGRPKGESGPAARKGYCPI